MPEVCSTPSLASAFYCTPVLRRDHKRGNGHHATLGSVERDVGALLTVADAFCSTRPTVSDLASSLLATPS